MTESRQLSFHAKALLLLLSICTLPTTTLILFLSRLTRFSPLVRPFRLRNRLYRSRRFQPRKVLVTGAGTPHGLRIARAFYETGHDVIGADFVRRGLPSQALFSRCIRKFHNLRVPSQYLGAGLYVRDVVEVIEREKPDLWISCADSTLISAGDDAQISELVKRGSISCTCFTVSAAVLRAIDNREALYEHTQTLGLPTPEVVEVRSRHELHTVLHRNNGTGKRYQLEAAPVSPDISSTSSVSSVDSHRAIVRRNRPGMNGSMNPQTLLPRRSLSQMRTRVAPHRKMTVCSHVADSCKPLAGRRRRCL